MHRFWYHSPVRFYRTLEELEDKLNPQNSQYFGTVGNPYPLEKGKLHRFLIPNDNNTLSSNDLQLFVDGVLLAAHFKIVDAKLHYITFQSDVDVCGRIEIKSDGITLFYSNYVRFLDSDDGDGRKFIRVATKHLYDRNLFLYKDNHYWMVTNLPAYSLGTFTTDVDVNNSRIGGLSTLQVRETFIDESVDYEFISEGDANILSFIQVHSTNNEFYIDGTKRTSLEKLDTEEFSMKGTMSFTNVKDKFGYNIILDEGDIFSDVYFIYSDEITYNFTYSHEPENDPNSGEWFLTNMLFVNYFNAFGIEYDCYLKVKLASVPAKGFLANNVTRNIYAIGDLISYCDKDDLVYFPNGFNNDSGVQGNFTEYFSYRIVDQAGRIGKLTTHTLIMTDSAVDPIDLSVSITWGDDTSIPITGNLSAINVKRASLVFDPSDPVVSQEWEIFNGTDWVFYKDFTTDLETISLSYLENKIRLKVVSQFGDTAYSNILQYTKISTANIYITDKVSTNGRCTYKLHVENEPFIGFANMIGDKESNGRNARINDTFGGVLLIPNDYEYGQFATKSKAVNIPVGVYNCDVESIGLPRNQYEDLAINGAVSYGYTPDYYDSSVQAEAHLIIPALNP